MSVESGIATELHGESLATDGVSLSAGGMQSAADVKSDFEAASHLWSADGDAERRPWRDFSIWGSSSSSETENSIWNAGGGGSLSTMLQHIAGEGLAAMKKPDAGSGDFAWRNATVMSAPNGSSESLGLSNLRQEPKPWYGGFGFGSNSVESNSFRQFSGGGDSWGMPSSTDSKSASVDWSVNKENVMKREQSGGWPHGTSEQEKTDEQPSGWPGSDMNDAAVHARTLSTVSDSSAGNNSDIGKPLSASSSGSVDPAVSTPQPTELTAEEQLIANMINSNEGWGTRPVRQDTPWVIETSSPTATTVVENVAGVAKADVGGSVWNSPKDTPGAGQYWGSAATGVNSTDWNVDGDIGVWIGPPSADAVNSNMWPGHANAAAGWPGIGPTPGGRVNSADLATALAGSWPDGAGSLPAALANKLAVNATANSSLDKSRPTDAQWLAALTKQQPGGGWASDPIPGTWGTADMHDPAGALMWAQLQLGAQQPKLGSGGHQFEVRPPTTGLTIGTWNEPPAVPDTLLHPGHWGQSPASAVCHPDFTALFCAILHVIY